MRTSASPQSLYDDERAYGGAFGDRRLREFATGRLCARGALASLGIYEFPLHVNADRTPRWPAGVVGSITHTDGFCGAIAARDDDARALGLDVERRGRVDEDLVPRIFTRREHERYRGFAPDARDLFATLTFSAKEAYYKCQFFLTRRWLDFTDVELDVAFDPDAAEGSFAVRTPVFDITLAMSGRYAIENALVGTSVIAVPIPER